MGKKGQQSGVGSSSGRDTTLAMTVNAEGDINYDSILRQGRNKDKIIYSDHKSLVPKVDALREVRCLHAVMHVLLVITGNLSVFSVSYQKLQPLGKRDFLHSEGLVSLEETTSVASCVSNRASYSLRQIAAD